MVREKVLIVDDEDINIDLLKNTLSDIYDILKYIQQRYTNILVSADKNQATFSNGDKIYFNGDNVLESIDKNVVIDSDTNTLQ
jgi:CheY-like chemotaxis protein